MIKKLKQFLKNNGLQYDFNKATLSDDGDGVIYISHWDYDIPQPSLKELEAIDTTALELQSELEQLDKVVVAKQARLIEDIYRKLDIQVEDDAVLEAFNRKEEIRVKAKNG